MRIYVHNNPELVKQKHKEIQKRHKRSYGDLLDSVPLAEIERWMSASLDLPQDAIRHIRNKHREVFAQRKPIDKAEELPKIQSSTVDASAASEIGCPHKGLAIVSV